MNLPRPHIPPLVLVGLLALASLSGCSSPSPTTASPPSPAEPVTEPPPPGTAPAPTFPSGDLAWTESVPSPVALYESQGLTANGRLYVFGSYHNEQIQVSARAFTFDPAAWRLFNLAPLPERVTHAGQARYRNKIYLKLTRFSGGSPALTVVG